MKRKLLSALIGIGLLNALPAQVSYYAFTQSSGTYTAITTGTVLGNTTSDQQVFVSATVPLGDTITTGVGIPIGFNFTYNGIVFDRLAVNNNGLISLGQSSLTPSVDISSSSNYTALSAISTASPSLLRSRIVALGADLAAQTGSSLRVSTTGTTPNRICIVQWTKYKKYGGTGDNYNFQIRLSETSNLVKIIYGAMTNGTTVITPQVGLGGTDSADFNNRTTTTNWAATTAGLSNNATCKLSSTVKPASGRTFIWTPPPPCTGTPSAGTASAPGLVCPGVNFDITLTGYTSGVSGITFQWQSSHTGIAGSFTDIPGGTTSKLTTSQTATTYYQCIVKCTSTGLSVTSNLIPVGMNALSTCYCTSSAANTSDEDILNVTLETLNNSSTCTTTGDTGSVLNKYSDFTTIAPPSLAQTLNIPFSVQVGTCGGNYGSAIKIFIDFNQNGSFADNGETVYTSATSVAGAHLETGYISIPSGAAIGNTRMRIVNQETSTPSSISDCGAYNYGETEDYSVIITGVTSCTGTPTAGTASAPAAICSGVNFNLALTGNTSGVAGITFQWQSSATGLAGSFTNISGGTTPTLATMQTAPTYYQCVVTCTSSGLSVTTNVVTVGMNTAANCYCTPPPTNCLQDDVITNVIFASINNTTDCSTDGYSYYATPNPVLAPGQTYPDSVTVGPGGTEYVGVWIDYDHSGTFDSLEFTALGSGNDVQIDSSITIPSTATAGSTVMRVRVRYNIPLTGADACIGYTYGETEDYLITISGTTGINEAELKGVSIYPNPTTGVLNVNFKAESTTLNVKLMNVAGQLIYNENMEHFTGTYSSKIDIANQAKGIYFLQVTSDNKVTTKKVVLY